MSSLEGNVAIVTGASSGIGRATAIRFAEEGAKVVACARSKDKLDALVDEISAKGGTAIAVRCDVSIEADIGNVVETAVRKFGTVHVLANIAQGGMGESEALAEVDAPCLIDYFRSGPIQALLFMQKCFPLMKEQSYGRIINTGSHGGTEGAAGYVGYNMAKGALQALTRTASQEWAKYGISSNIFLPIIRTEAAELNQRVKDAFDWLETTMPGGRVGTAYDDCTPILAFLASKGAGYINGQAIGVDGGRFRLA